MSTQMHEDNPELLQDQPDRSLSPQASPPHDTAQGAPAQTQLDFARSVFANIQELNRTMDAKANYLLASVALLTAALGLVASRALAVTVQEDWQRLLKGTAIVLVLGYLLVAFTVIYLATGIYQARSQRVSARTEAPGMLFPLMLLHRYSVDGKADESAYLDRLRTLQSDDILQDYSNQIIEVSIIYEAKQKQVNMCLSLFRWAGILWLLTMLVVVLVVVILP